jgi:hypothetical protein
MFFGIILSHTVIFAEIITWRHNMYLYCMAASCLAACHHRTALSLLLLYCYKKNPALKILNFHWTETSTMNSFGW